MASRKQYPGDNCGSFFNGKGSRRREPSFVVSDKEMSENWCAAFGHRPDHQDGTDCITCGQPIAGKQKGEN